MSQVSRELADNWLRLFVVLELLHQGTSHNENAWHLVTTLWTLPAVLLAPFNGALCNSLPKRPVLVAAAALGLAATLAGLTETLPWLACWAVVAVSFAVYGPTRYALYPAGSQDTQLSLPRLNGLFEMGSAAAVVAGFLLAAHFGVETWQQFASAGLGVAGLHFLAVTFAVPVTFASDVRRPESAFQAVLGFFRDSKRIWQKREARGCLIGLACVRAVITAFTGAVLAEHFNSHGAALPVRLLELGIWVGLGVALGSLLVSWQKHPWRVLGLVPWGALGFTSALILAACGVEIGRALCMILGITFALVNVPLSAGYQGFVPADARGNGMAARNFCDFALTTLLVGAFFLLNLAAALQFWLLAIFALVMTWLSWRFFLREVVELAFEWALLPLYRITAEGPGCLTFPREGPVLLVANHSAWLDPFWIGKVFPRRNIPMMTSLFYDLPGLRWLLVRFVQPIRVQAATYRRDVPELLEAKAALDRGEVLLLFPEGSMRKREDRPLKQFGQGIWHILQETPHVPVVVCWIEGGWGSFFSYWSGQPTKNKRFDFFRRIRIGVSEPHLVPAGILADLRATREYLMRACLAARAHLGLEPLGLGNAEDDDDGSREAASG